MNINYQLTARSGIKNILKLSTLGCVLAMTTFNSCHAMDGKQYEAIDYGYKSPSCMKYLHEALQNYQT